MRRDPATAIAVLDAMLQFFDGGQRWIRGSLRDPCGHRCLIGALSHIRATLDIRRDPAACYLRCAAGPFAARNDDSRQAETEVCLMLHNDDCGYCAGVYALICAARALARAEPDPVATRFCGGPVSNILWPQADPAGRLIARQASIRPADFTGETKPNGTCPWFDLELGFCS
jgi:hypothetical protein